MQYDLVFEGGGAKGFVFVGAMQEFEAMGHTHGRLLGTSAGAITAALLAAGYTSGEMLAALKERQGDKSVFASFMGDIPPIDRDAIKKSSMLGLLQTINLHFLPDFFEGRLDERIVRAIANKPKLRHLFSFMEYGGWFSADAFVTWMTGKLNSGLFDGKPRNFGAMTMAQLYSATKKDLTLVATDISDNLMLVLNHRTAPNLPVVWAVRMSMNIPMLWQEVIWKKEWGRFIGRDISGHSIVDGGVLSNFPLELFVSGSPTVTAVMGPDASKNVIGMLIDESQEVPGVKASQPPRAEALTDLPTVQRLGNLVNTMMGARDKMVMEAFERYVVRLPAKGYGTVEFDMEETRQEKLVAAGRNAMKSFFDDNDTRKKSLRTAAAKKTADRLAERLLTMQ
jgi:predicted acylesterase/phospholipase RssA